MKLVRDRIPELFPEAGNYAQGDDRLVDRLLTAKIVEEVAEVFGASTAEEMTEEIADVIESLHAYAAQVGVTPEVIEQVRLLKRAQRGGFEQGWILG